MKCRTFCSVGAFALALIMFSTVAQGGLIVNPVNPTPSDSITIEYSTWLSNPGVVVTNTVQTVNGNNITLDIYAYQEDGLWSPVLVPYEHTFSIGELPVGIYQIQASYDLQSTSFEVIPEPHSVALLLVGSGVFYLRKRRICK